VSSAGDGEKPDGERRAREEREDREVRDELDQELDETGRRFSEAAAELNALRTELKAEMEDRFDKLEAMLRPLIRLTEELLQERRRRGEQ
jgi:hypothetical protein